MDYWKNDAVQFARLLVEIDRSLEIDRAELCFCLKIDRADLAELFERARIAHKLNQKPGAL